MQTTAAPQHAYRPHLDGIRAVAVILVIVFHLGFDWAPGGFVGVDVFFVLSGYLITSLLVGELARSGRVDLARFYARRVRRLLPAAALVVGVVIVLTTVLMDRADQAGVGQDATLSALYAANWRFALTEVDYFAPGDVYSPLIHFWSLGIEEQFYVFWPAMLLGLWAIVRRVRRGAGGGAGAGRGGGERLLLGAVLVLAAISAALSLLLEPGPLTYYGTHTRAYQLLAGAALAIAARQMASRPEGPAAGADASARLRNAGVATSAAAFVALLMLTHEIPNAREYPGIAGIAVTAASAALIAGLDLMGAHPLQRLAGARLPAAIGRLSYSLYLWHWPAIVFMPLLATRFELGFLGTRPSMVVAMTVFAVLSFRLWERPMRFNLRIRAPARRVVAAGLAASVVLSLVSIPLLQPSSGFEGRALAAVKDLARPGDCPYFARDWGDSPNPRACVRRRGGGLTVALVGDSHAQQWEPALALLAARHDLTLVRATRGGCAPNDTLVDRDEDIRGVTGSGEECAAWRHRVLPDLVRRYDPDVIFVGTRSHVAGILVGGREITPFTREHRRAWSDSWDWTLRTLSAGGARIVVSEILPTLPQRVPACLAAAGRPTRSCDFQVKADRDVKPYNAIVRRLADRAPRIGIFDPTPIACPGGVCHAMAGEVIVHRDDSHLSATFVRARAAQVEAALERAGAKLDH
jgi:peptidoglycan/LPS O-acetylase OafA/YrhL